MDSSFYLFKMVLNDVTGPTFSPPNLTLGSRTMFVLCWRRRTSSGGSRRSVPSVKVWRRRMGRVRWIWSEKCCHKCQVKEMWSVTEIQVRPCLDRDWKLFQVAMSTGNKKSNEISSRVKHFALPSGYTHSHMSIVIPF